MDKHRFARWLRKHRWTIAYSILAAYAVVIPITIILFPDNSLWLALLVVVIGLLGELRGLADMLEDD